MHKTRGLKLLGVGLIAVMLAACAEGAAQYQSEQRVNRGGARLEQQRDLVVCRVDNRDLGYGETFLSKIPRYDEYKNEPLDCRGLLDHEFIQHSYRSADMGFGGGDTVKLAQYNGVHWDVWTDEVPELQWMHLHPDVKACAIVWHSAKRNVLIRNCDGHLVLLGQAGVASDTPACGKADVPVCPSQGG